nr:MAG TPA: type I neck protein [Caudoviricetes sp.]
MITIKQKGDFKKLDRYLERLLNVIKRGELDKYGRMGVDALMAATPVDSGKTARSWYYEVKHTNGGASIVFRNSNVNDGVPIAIILQLGHGTGTGGYVAGRDYINPAVQPIFDQIANDAWKEVTSL